MGSKVTVAIVGDDLSSFANSLWAAARLAEFVPDRVHIILVRENLAERAASVARLVLSSVDSAAKPEVATVLLSSPGFMDWGRKAAEIVKQEKDSGNIVALDVTAAPKEGAIAASIASWNRKVDRVFHLDERNYTHLDNPLMLLPLPELKLNEYVAESKESGSGATANR